jgi:hypothetical protein
LLQAHGVEIGARLRGYGKDAGNAPDKSGEHGHFVTSFRVAGLMMTMEWAFAVCLAMDKASSLF